MKVLMVLCWFALFHTDLWAATADSAQAIPVMDYEAFFDSVNQQNDVLYVINFWATWCKPCVQELPVFLEADAQYSSDPDFKMVLVSLDWADRLETVLFPFLSQHEIKTDVWVLDDGKRMNTWIPMVSEKWSGAIPCTVFYKNAEVVFFHEGTISAAKLENKINKYL